MLIIPPGSGIVHQVNLEYLARVVFADTRKDGSTILYPDSVVGTGESPELKIKFVNLLSASEKPRRAPKIAGKN